MKSFINERSDIVAQSILGLLSNQKLAVLDRFPQIKVVVRRDWDKSKVALISGGGSGHQPSHAGFVGKGMLTAAVCGQIFASPSVDAVLSAILAVTGDQGCLLIIKNYTGDRLNFGLAAEQARMLGRKVECVIVGDDVALGQDVLKRGTAGTLFIHKIAGYHAQQNKSLSQIAEIVKKASSQIYSIGLALNQCCIFDTNKQSRLTSKEAELGLGIHGEPGAKIIEYANADMLMEIAAHQLQSRLPDQNCEYALLLNNLGFVTQMQMHILLNSLRKTALSKNVKYIVGPNQFMTALNMSGFSISVIELNQQIVEALLAHAQPQNWSRMKLFVEPHKVASPQLNNTVMFQASKDANTQKVVREIASILIKIEDQINQLDKKVGDGDTGTTFATASKKIIAHSQELPYANVGQLLHAIGKLLSREVGGSSGVLLSILFIAASADYQKHRHLGDALDQGLSAMKKYGGAGKGSRTMIDALQPAFEALRNNLPFEEVAKQARKGAEGTKDVIKTKYGRSSYVPQDKLKGVPDPGAEAVAIVFEHISRTLAK